MCGLTICGWKLSYSLFTACRSLEKIPILQEKTLESPLDCKEIQPVHSKDQSWVFTVRTDAKAETPVLWPPHVKSWLIGKDSDAGRDWGQEEKGMTEDEMAGWHHWLYGRESEWIPGVGDGQGSLAYYDSWGHKESDTTERLNWIELNWIIKKDQWPWERRSCLEMSHWDSLLQAPECSIAQCLALGGGGQSAVFLSTVMWLPSIPLNQKILLLSDLFFDCTLKHARSLFPD